MEAILALTCFLAALGTVHSPPSQLSFPYSRWPPAIHSLLTMPLTASSTNVMEMNKAMISSVDLPAGDMPHKTG